MFSEKHKKEMPFLGMLGMGGGIGSNLVAGGGVASIDASGGTKTTAGSYTIHTFTSSGSLVIASGDGDVDYLIVGGGGGGGKDNYTDQDLITQDYQVVHLVVDLTGKQQQLEQVTQVTLVEMM